MASPVVSTVPEDAGPMPRCHTRPRWVSPSCHGSSWAASIYFLRAGGAGRRRWPEAPAVMEDVASPTRPHAPLRGLGAALALGQSRWLGVGGAPPRRRHAVT